MVAAQLAWHLGQSRASWRYAKSRERHIPKAHNELISYLSHPCGV